MNCEKTQERIDSYINRTLPDHDLESFIRHVRQCPDCFEELETYYIVDIAMQYLDEEKEDSYHITKLLDDDLTRRLQWVKRKRRLLFLFFILAGVIIAGLSVGSWFWL